MKISSEIASAAKIIGEEKTIEYFAKAGFDAWDFSMFEMAKYDYINDSVFVTNHPLTTSQYLSFARKLKHIGEECGIECNQSHAPFPVRHPKIRSMLKRAIECTAEAGGRICVIHPDNYKSAQENAEMYLELLPFAKECNVKIATENMFNWDRQNDCALPAACSDFESFSEHINAVNSDSFGVCLDIGHSEMQGLNASAEELILKLNKNIIALHIHDNDKRHDSHQIPFSMDIDFSRVAAALKKINYSGYLTLECDQYLKTYTKDNIFDGITNMAESVKRIDRMINEC